MAVLCDRACLCAHGLVILANQGTKSWDVLTTRSSSCVVNAAVLSSSVCILLMVYARGNPECCTLAWSAN